MQMLIGGRHVDAYDRKTVPVYNPATQALIDSVPYATYEDVDTALTNAVQGAA